MNQLMLWVIVSVVALLVDIATSAFLFIWFTMGGIAAIIAMIFGCSFTVQLIVFIAVSAISMGIGYPIARRSLGRTVTKTSTMEERYLGREITVDDDIIETARVKIDGIYWTIKNSGDPVKKGDKVKIVAIEGNKLMVEKEIIEREKE